MTPLAWAAIAGYASNCHVLCASTKSSMKAAEHYIDPTTLPEPAKLVLQEAKSMYLGDPSRADSLVRVCVFIAALPALFSPFLMPGAYMCR